MVRLLELQKRSEPNVAWSASYLWQVAYTTMLDELRRLRRSTAVLVPDGEGEHSASAPGPRQRPEVALGIRDCLEGLLPQRLSAVMLHLQGFSLEEASRLLAAGAPRVRNLIWRGMADLRRCLDGKGLLP
jgi:RNA polymerase sigma-70 factor (ECF subfamily)